MRELTLVFSITVRFAGVLLGLWLLFAGLVPEIPQEMVDRPAALALIIRLPQSLLLAGWLLVPYSLLRSGFLYRPCLVALTVASAILVIAAGQICLFYGVREASGGALAAFFAGLSLVLCALQPVAVIAARRQSQGNLPDISGGAA